MCASATSVALPLRKPSLVAEVSSIAPAQLKPLLLSFKPLRSSLQSRLARDFSVLVSLRCYLIIDWNFLVTCVSTNITQTFF